ncbi:MAG TPA: hypothetical protein VGD60_15180 [Candidatus Acidoferrales bacterium]
MLSRRIQDGVTFVSQCVNHIFRRGALHCPHCDGVLKEQVAQTGPAYLVCPAKGKGCPDPVKSFESSIEMYEWRDSTWQIIERACK